MAVVQIPNLPAAIALSGSEQLEAVQAGTSVRITVAQIGQATNLPAAPNLSLQFNSNGVFGGSAGITTNGLARITLGAQQTSQGSLVLANTAAGAWPVTLQSSNSATAAWTMTLPPAVAAGNGFILTSNTSGVTSWTNPTALGIDLDVGTTAITNGTVGCVLFQGAGNVLQQSANLFWDNTNTRLGIGTATPGAALDINSTDLTRIARIGDYLGTGSLSTPAFEAMGSRSDANQTFQGRIGLSFRRTDGTAITSGTFLGMTAFGGQFGTGTTYSAANLLYSASIKGVAEGSFTASTVMPTAITFSTGSTGENLTSPNTAYGAERMRITSAGDVNIVGAGSAGTSQAVSFSGSAPINTLVVNSLGSLLVGAPAFSSSVSTGTAAIGGIGIYPFSNNAGATNTTILSSLNIESATAWTGNSGASGLNYYALASTPKLVNSGSGGTSNHRVFGGYFGPNIQSSGASASVSMTGCAGEAIRYSASDFASANFILAGSFVASHAATLPSTATTTQLTGVVTNAFNDSGVVSGQEGQRANVRVGSAAGAGVTSVTTLSSFRSNTYLIGAATGNTATVTNAYGVNLIGPTVNATGTVTNYYGYYLGAATVTGTLTNRWGVYIDDSVAANYFAGNVGLGRTPTNFRLEVAGNQWLQSATQPTTFWGNTLADYAVTYYLVSTKTAYFGADGTGTQTVFTSASTERIRLTSAGDVNIKGAGTAGVSQAVSFSGSANINTLVVNASSNVGIGTSSPGAKLHSVVADGTSVLGLSGTSKGIRVETNSTSLVIRGVDNTLATSYEPLGFGGSYLYFETNGTIEAMRIDATRNVLVGTTSSPTTGTQCLTIETGTAPTATPADTVTFYSSDLSAGNTIPSIYTEGTGIVSSNTGTTNLSNRIAVRINGTVYYLLAASSA